MKKLMIAAAIVCAAAFAQAATYNWNLQADYIEDTTAAGGYEGAYLNGGLALAVFDANVTDAGKLAAELAKGNFDGLYAANLGESATMEYGAINAFGSGIKGNGDPDAKPTPIPDTAVSAFAVIFNNADIDKADYFWISEAGEGIIDETVQGGGNAAIGLGALNTGDTWTKIDTVPEPTSGLLLLLGVAGLALRRRRV